MSGDKIIIQNLENKIKELSYINENYKARIIYLENTFNNLENQIQNLKLIRQNFLSKEEIYQNEKLEVAQKNQKILELQSDIINLKIEHEKYKNKKSYVGIGDWGLGIGDWGLGIGPNPQSPIPNPQYPFSPILYYYKNN